MQLKSKEQKGQIQEILDLTKQDFSDVQMGRTMVLYRAPTQRILELLRNLALERLILSKFFSDYSFYLKIFFFFCFQSLPCCSMLAPRLFCPPLPRQTFKISPLSSLCPLH